MNPTETARIGSTALRVTRLAFGAGTIGGMYAPVSDQEASGAIQSALAMGVRFFDVAPFYGHGTSELRLGAELRLQPRNSFVLATKVGRLLTPAPMDSRPCFFHNAAPFVPVFDFSYDAVMRSFEESLKRLQLDRIDILHIHDPDDHYEDALRYAYPALARLRSSGAIQAIGVGMNQSEMLVRFASEADFDCFLIAGRYTLIDHSALRELLPLCLKKKASVFAGAVYNSGILATGAVAGAKFNYEDAPANVIERVKRVEKICNDFSVPLKAAAIQFPLAHPAVTSVIVGCRQAFEIEENFRLMSVPIPGEFWEALKDQVLIPVDAPVPKTANSTPRANVHEKVKPFTPKQSGPALSKGKRR
jgi:D-threo-aldose 1-dehydrogenase